MMRYKNLGRTGLKVSELSLGSWLTFGSTVDAESTTRCVELAFEHGMNFFDNAEVYGGGEAERVMGRALSRFRREDLVVSTKLYWGGDGPNDTGLSRKHVIEGMKNSLARLGMGYVDVVFCHRADPATPMEETVRAMNYLLDKGFAFYWGTSEWTAEQIVEALEIADHLKLVGPAVEQPQYNLLWRHRVEEEYVPLFEEHGLGATVWSPLCSGVLTGKYAGGVPEGTRLAEQPWLLEKLSPETEAKISDFVALARELKVTPAQLAIVWCLRNPHVTTVLLGASSEAQLMENLGSLEAVEVLTPIVSSQLDRLFPVEKAEQA